MSSLFSAFILVFSAFLIEVAVDYVGLARSTWLADPAELDGALQWGQYVVTASLALAALRMIRLLVLLDREHLATSAELGARPEPPLG